MSAAPQGLTKPSPWRGALTGLSAAALFGVSVPLAKALGLGLSPAISAGLLYLGSAVGLFLLQCFQERPSSWWNKVRELLKAKHWLFFSYLFGGVVAPLCFMKALQLVSGSTVSLFLNFETLFTALLGWRFFRERFSARASTGLALIFLGGVVLSWNGDLHGFSWWGLLAVLAAALGWAIDTNATRQMAEHDALWIAIGKGLVGGLVNLTIGAVERSPWPQWSETLGLSLVGFIGYGVGLSLFILSLRRMGLAKSLGYFSTAPFIAAFFSILLLQEFVTLPFCIAGVLMLVGVFLQMSES